MLLWVLISNIFSVYLNINIFCVSVTIFRALIVCSKVVKVAWTNMHPISIIIVSSLKIWLIQSANLRISSPQDHIPQLQPIQPVYHTLHCMPQWQQVFGLRWSGFQMNEVAKCQELTLSRRRACLRSRFGIFRQSGRNTEKVLVLHFDHHTRFTLTWKSKCPPTSSWPGEWSLSRLDFHHFSNYFCLYLSSFYLINIKTSIAHLLI